MSTSRPWHIKMCGLKAGKLLSLESGALEPSNVIEVYAFTPEMSGLETKVWVQTLF